MCLRTLNLGSTAFGREVIFPGYFVDFSIESSATKKEAKAWRDGTRKTVASAIGDTTTTLKLSFEYLDFQHLGFAYDQLPSNLSNLSIPILIEGVVPNVSPYTVSNPDIVTGQVTGVYVVTGPNAGDRPLTGTGSPTIASGSVTFTSADAGQSVAIAVNKLVTSIDTIGADTNPDRYGNMSFFGKGYGPLFPKGIGIYCPSISRNTVPNFTTGDVPKFEVDFSINAVAGYNQGFVFYDWNSVPVVSST